MFGNFGRGNEIALAKQRIAQRRQIPGGAHAGAMAGAAPMQQYNQPQYPQQYQGYPQVPQGAPDGSMAGCGIMDNCAGPVATPFMGMQQPTGPWMQNQALLGLVATPATLGSFTLSVTCGNKFFYGCGARSFNSPLQLLVTSIISGFNGYERTCGPDAGFDVAFWNTDDCYCPFDWGCFSNLAPLTITFDPLDTLSVLPTLDMIIVGKAVNFFNDCWPMFPGTPPGYGGGVAGGPPMVVGQPTGGGSSIF
jgi:hypothetical protein